MKAIQVLLTAASTELGQRLIHSLVNDKRVARIVALIEPKCYPNARLLSHRKLSYEPIDLIHERAIKQFIFGPKCRGLTHLVHLAMHRDALLSGRRYHRLNVEALRQLFQLAEDHPSLSHFIFRSWSEIYELHSYLPNILDEEHPIDYSARRPQWLRDRVAADQFLCAKLGVSPLKVKILRCADCLAPGYGSQLYAFLHSLPCLVPLGYDPVVNVLSPDDLTDALLRACFFPGEGVFAIPGRDSMPLSELMERCHRAAVPLPDPVLQWADRLKQKLARSTFCYEISRGLFHYGGVMTGAKAEQLLGYRASHPIDWPLLNEQLR